MSDDFLIERAPEPVIKEHRGPSDEVLRSIRERHQKELESKIKEEENEASVILDHGSVHVSTTTSPATLAQYAKRASQVYKRYLKINGYPPNTNIDKIDVSAFIGWVMTLKTTLKPRSWRVYRQSIYRFLMSLPDHEDVTEALNILEHDTAVRSEYGLGGGKPKNEAFPCVDGKVRENSSSKKEKRLPEKDLEKIITYLRHISKAIRTYQLEAWIKAGIITGLRPSEWKTTELSITPDSRTIHGRRAFLYVINAKATNGRGNGVVRTLDLTRLPDDLLKYVKYMSENGRKWYLDSDFDKEQKETGLLLSKVCRVLWPNRKYHFSLYSCRHQAVANWKSSGMSKMEIACLAGHRSIETATERYGRRTSGWKNVPDNNIIKPVKEDMERALKHEADIKARIEARNLLKNTNSPNFTR